MIDIVDIAHALANTCRFTGHSLAFYSVAQHCTHMVAMLRAEGAPHEVLRAALLHDVDEAYLPDVPRPVKPFLWVEVGEHRAPAYTPANEFEPDAPTVRHPDLIPWRDFADRIAHVVAERYRLPYYFADHPLVKQADIRMLATERRDIMAPPPLPWVSLENVQPYREEIESIPPRVARECFLQHFATLFKGEKIPASINLWGRRRRPTSDLPGEW